MSRLRRGEAARNDADARSEPGATFFRGLTLGALIGAAIAGSAIWKRRAGSQGRRPAAPDEVRRPD